MPSATVVASFTEGAVACLAVAVNEGGALGRCEYIGRVDMDAAWQAMNATQRKEALRLAVKAARDASIRPAPSDLGISGSLTV